MNEIDFEAKLRADGTPKLKPKASSRDRPRRSTAIPSRSAASFSGAFSVTQDSQRTVYRPGQAFAVADGHPHDESIGREGARVRVGRKFAKV